MEKLTDEELAEIREYARLRRDAENVYDADFAVEHRDMLLAEVDRLRALLEGQEQR